MAAVAATVPPALTIEQKIEQAYDDISSILHSSASITSLDDFMKEYQMIKKMPLVSVLTSRIDDLFEKNATTPRTITASDVRLKLMNQLRDIMSQKREDVAKYVLHTDGQTDFTPKRLMCLFVCGLVAFREVVPFENWMNLTNNNEIDYVRKFLLVIAEPQPRQIVVYSTTVNGGLTIDGEANRTIPDTLFLTSSIPDNARNVVIMDSFPDKDPWSTLSQSIHNEDVITSDPVLWYAYILQNTRPVIAFADSTQAHAQCIGIDDREKDRKYIFVYQFPTYDRQNSPTDQATLWRPYINEPCEAYANVLESFKPGLTAETAFISKYTYTNPMIIYIHVLVMALYGENRNFYACAGAADVGIERSLVAGVTCEKYRDLLEHVSHSRTALTIRENVMDENVMERLANAHLELMRKNAAFTFDDVIDVNYKDTLNSTCPVQYGWVFRDEKLSKCAGWTSTIKQVLTVKSTRNKDVLDPELGVFRRILHCMNQNLNDADELKGFIRKFKPAEVKIGARVDGDLHKNIAVNLYTYGAGKGIFTSKSKKEDFLSKDPMYRAAMEKYFEGDWHPDNVFGKYLVYNNEEKSYEVRDCFQIDIDNANVSNMLSVPPERLPSGSATSSNTAPAGRLPSTNSTGSSNTSQKSFDPENPPPSPLLPHIKGAWKAGQAKKPVSNTMKTVLEMVDTWVDTDERVEGGIGAILRQLNDFATVDGMNKDDRRKKMADLTAEIQKRHDELNQQKTMLDKEIDGLKAEIQKSQDEATKDKDALQAQMKTVRDEKDEVDKKLAASLLRENALIQEKNDMDTNMQKITGEKDDLAAQVAKLNHELQDSQKKAAEDAESIRKLTEKVGGLEKEIARLTQEIDTLTLKQTNLLASDASKQAQIDALALKDKELADALAREAQLKVEKQDLENKLAATNKLLSTDATQLLQMGQDKLQLQKDIADLQAKIQEYEDQLKTLIEKLKKGILEHDRQMTTRIWKIHDQVDGSIRRELTESELLVLLRKGEYMGFRDAVKRPVDQKEYKLPALFLIYESIGGTWSYFDKLGDKTQTSDFMAEKLMESLRLFQTIKKHNEHLLHTYTNQYFRKFLETFGCLANDPDKGEVIETF